MNPRQLLSAFKQEFERRKFVGGLLLAFIRFFRALDAFDGAYRNLNDLFHEYPQLAVTSQGKTANTLIVSIKDESGRV